MGFFWFSEETANYGLALNRSDRRRTKLASKKVSFPVGKVNFLEIPPMTFCEFLDAVGEGEKRKRLEERAWPTINAFHKTYSALCNRECCRRLCEPKFVVALVDGCGVEPVACSAA